MFKYQHLRSNDDIEISSLLARFVGKKAGLAGKTEEEELQAEIILDHVYDFVKGTTTSESFI